MADDQFGFVSDEELGFVPDQESPKQVETAKPEADHFLNLDKPIISFGDSNATDTGANAVIEGAGQGLTLGGASRVKSAIETGLQKLASPVTGEQRSFGELYDIHKKQYEQTADELHKKHPLYELGGNVVGGLASGKLLPSGYAAKGIASGAGALLAKMGIEETPAALKALSGILGIGTEGAIQGAAQGALSSKADIGSKESNEDVAKSAKFGGIVGAGIGAAGLLGGAAAGAGANYLEKKAAQLETSPNRRMRQLALAYKRTRSGLPAINANDTESSVGLAGELRQGNSEFVNRFVDAENTVGKKLTQTIEDATDKGVKIPLDSALDQSSKELQNLVRRRPDLEFDPQYSKLTDKLFQLQNNKLSPSEAYALKEDVYNFANKLGDQELVNTAKNFAGGVGKSMEANVPGYSDLNSQFKTLRESGRETLMNQGREASFNNDWISSFNNDKVKTERNVEHLIGGLSAQGAGQQVISSKQSFNNLVNSLTDAEKTHPGTLQMLGYDSIDALKKDLYAKSDLLNLNRSISGIQPVAEKIPTGVGDLISKIAGLGNPYKAAQTAGKIAYKIHGAPKVPSFNSSMEEAGAFADNLIGSGEASRQKYGQALKDAVQNGDIPKKNATLFVLQQLHNHKESKKEPENE